MALEGHGLAQEWHPAGHVTTDCQLAAAAVATEVAFVTATAGVEVACHVSATEVAPSTAVTVIWEYGLPVVACDTTAAAAVVVATVAAPA
jgi:hypothetical protein